MNCLETKFYAVYEQPAQTAAFPSNDLPLSYGGAGLRPEGVGAWDKPYSPVMVYRWDAVRDALWTLAKVSGGTPFDGPMIRYAQPVTGGWALKTKEGRQSSGGGGGDEGWRSVGGVVV